MTRIDDYLRLVDSFRESRRFPGWKAEDDRSLLAHLEDLYGDLSDTEAERVEAQGWRAWPKRYDARMVEGFEAVLLDAADDGGGEADRSIDPGTGKQRGYELTPAEGSGA